MIVPLLLGSLVIPVKDRASAFKVQAETIGTIAYDPRGFAGVHSIYSDGTTVRVLDDFNKVPSNARWVTFMPINFDGWSFITAETGLQPRRN